MKTFVVLAKLTQRGKSEITETFERRQVLTPAMERLAVSMDHYFLTLGAYDFVAVFSAPSEVEMAEFLLVMNRLGAVETTTMVALAAPDYAGVIERLGGGS